MGIDQPWTPRHMCYRCHRPIPACLCSRVTRVSNRTAIWIVQHPHERFHPFGTARFARLGLERVQTTVCFRSSPTPPRGWPSEAAVLYPAPDAEDLAALDGAESPSALVVIDGTWHHARGIYRDNPWLRRLPCYRLRPSQPGRYRIRRAPAPHCLSTIEAIVFALQQLEPHTRGLGQLLAAFESMIDEQIQISEQRRSGRSRRPRRAPRGGVPRIFTAAPERLLVVYGESCATSSSRRRARRLVQWAAVRPSTGEIFDGIVAPAGAEPSARHLRHMGLEAIASERGVPIEQLAQAWGRFRRDDDVVVAYNQSTVDLLRRQLGDGAPSLLLKAAYCNVRRGACGTMDDVLEREGLVPAPVAVQGRARARLGNAVALLGRLQAMAATDVETAG